MWIAGLHTAEGPGVDPFLLAPVAGAIDWTVRPIVEGPSELQGVGRKAAMEFFAWVRPVDVHGEAPRKPVAVYRSQDSGRTWRPVTAPGAVSERPMKRFARITARSSDWRIADREDGGFDVQRRDAGGWRTVKAFPWKRCGPKEARP